MKYILFGFQTSTEYEYYSSLENPANTNTNIFGFEKSSEYEYEYYSILFGLKISDKYEYEYDYSVSTIRILSEYRIIRSPLI